MTAYTVWTLNQMAAGTLVLTCVFAGLLCLNELRRSVRCLGGDRQTADSASRYLKGSHMTPEVTNHAGIANWLERYRRAWIDRNAISAGELFTADAVYREQPFQAPFVGRQAIEQYWATVTATQSDIELRYGPLIVSGHQVAVEWWANLRNGGAPVTLAGEFFLSFAESGLCRELREYWAFTEGRVEPPDSLLFK